MIIDEMNHWSRKKEIEEEINKQNNNEQQN